MTCASADASFFGVGIVVNTCAACRAVWCVVAVLLGERCSLLFASGDSGDDAFTLSVLLVFEDASLNSCSYSHLDQYTQQVLWNCDLD